MESQANKYSIPLHLNENSSNGPSNSIYRKGFAKNFLKEAGMERDSVQTTPIVSFPQEEVIHHRNLNKNTQGVSHSLILDEWEGCITDVKEDTFIAKLYKQTQSESDLEIIEGEFEIRSVPEQDRHLIKEGVLFYWMIGREVKETTQIIHGDTIIFRRMPSWKGFDINNSSAITDEFFNALSGKY